jgi:hypothetical protein
MAYFKNTFILFFLLQACGTRSDVDLETKYHQLEIICAQIPKLGANKARNEELSKTRDFFAARGNEAAMFLVHKLQKIVSEERQFLGDSEDRSKVGDYLIYLYDQGQSNLRKYVICNILADMFPQLGDDVQLAILKAITSAYTPSSYGREDMSALHYAMLRIGPKAVPYLLELANHRYVGVRCSISDGLQSMAGDSADSAKSLPVRIDCRASEEERLAQIRAWRKWWEESGRPMGKTHLSSFFEMDSSPAPAAKDPH